VSESVTSHVAVDQHQNHNAYHDGTIPCHVGVVYWWWGRICNATGGLYQRVVVGWDTTVVESGNSGDVACVLCFGTCQCVALLLLSWLVMCIV
jgi:hypothetical protein